MMRGMDTHNDPTPTTSPTIEAVADLLALADTVAESHPVRAAYFRDVARPFVPEWRRRSLEGRDPFVAVADMTDRVAGR